MRAISPKTLKKKELQMENKITTRESLNKVLKHMSNEEYYKRFNRLFKEYIDPRNKDKNAFYYKLLQHLTDAGLTKTEAEEFFKDMRVKNAHLIQSIEESQAKIKESIEKFDKAKFDLLTNPVNVKSYLIMFMETIKIIEQTLNKIEKESMLNVNNKEHFQEKIKEIRELLKEPKQELEEKLKKEAGFNEVLMLQQMKTTFDKISDRLGEIGAELATERTINEVINEKYIDKEQGQEGQKEKEAEKENPQAPADTQAPAAPEKETESPEKDAYVLSDAIYKAELELNTPTDKFNEPDYKEKLAYLALINYAVDKNLIKDNILTKIESSDFNLDFLKEKAQTILQTYDLYDAFNKINNDIKRNTDDILVDDTTPEATESAQNITLDKALENSLHATLNSVNTELDEKTLSFLTLSEYLHAYNNHNLSDVFEKFKDTFNKDEFKAIVLYNKALMNNDVDDLFDFVVEQNFEAANINEYAKMLKHNFPKYVKMDEELEKELMPKQVEKELEIGAPQKNKKFRGLEI